ncbi:MAG: thiolase domain-containing protein [Chloroflexota bacterium]|nr:thiolase domain-containing protein [Chloroflexota bacterium]
MRDVSIIGIGQTPVSEHWHKSLRQLAGEAVLAALQDAGLQGWDSGPTLADALYVGNMLSGEIAAQEHLGALIADFAGLRGTEACKVEAACCSGAAALRIGYQAVAGGLKDIVVACGVEKMTDVLGRSTTAALALAGDGDYEAAMGLSFVAINALLMRRYMHEYGFSHQDFAPFSVNAHRNGVGNPNAMFQRPVTPQAFVQAKMIADPISLLDSSPITDGAAAVVLAPKTQAKEFTDHAVHIRASATATDSVALHDRRDPLFLSAAYQSARKAYQQAGIGPQDLDLLELHDAFTIMAALSLEACGFAERGQGVRLAQEGEITLEGSIPICTMGGLKARGHPVGATGLYQVVELVQQLRGQAGANQIEGATLGMAQNIGGSGATAITHVLERTE